jgi:hypothetical protein
MLDTAREEVLILTRRGSVRLLLETPSGLLSGILDLEKHPLPVERVVPRVHRGTITPVYLNLRCVLAAKTSYKTLSKKLGMLLRVTTSPCTRMRTGRRTRRRRLRTVRRKRSTRRSRQT